MQCNCIMNVDCFRTSRGSEDKDEEEEEEEKKKRHERTKGKEKKRHGRKNKDGEKGSVQDKDDEKEGLWRKRCFTFCMGVAAVLCCLLRCAAVCLPIIAELTKKRR